MHTFSESKLSRFEIKYFFNIIIKGSQIWYRRISTLRKIKEIEPKTESET